MRKIQLLAVLWTLILAVPFTALALVATAYITEHLIEISNIIANLSQNIFPKGLNLVFEFEVISMIAGLIIILAILFLALRTSKNEDPQTS